MCTHNLYIKFGEYARDCRYSICVIEGSTVINVYVTESVFMDVVERLGLKEREADQFGSVCYE